MTFLIGLSLGLLLLIGYHFFRNNQERTTLLHLHKMLQQAISGDFHPQKFDESQLSSIENHMYRYLTDNYHSKQSLEQQKKKIQTMITDLSHQTTTPISNILLYSEILEEQLNSDLKNSNLSELQDEISSIVEQTQKLDFLVQSLVKVSRLEQGIITIHPATQNLMPLFHAIQDAYKEKANQKNQQFIVPSSTDLSANFDLKWTNEAIGNIVDNAIKYTDCGGLITLSVVDYELFTCIHITDSGIGIKESEIAQIFQRFYRSPDVNNASGTGIGLYLSREIIQSENGYIKVQSEYGKGSTFSIYLPK